VYVYLLYSFKIILLKTSFATTLKDSIISYGSTSGNFSKEKRQITTKVFSLWKIGFFQSSQFQINYCGSKPRKLTEYFVLRQIVDKYSQQIRHINC
jgi:hypothetical protein